MSNLGTPGGFRRGGAKCGGSFFNATPQIKAGFSAPYESYIFSVLSAKGCFRDLLRGCDRQRSTLTAFATHIGTIFFLPQLLQISSTLRSKVLFKDWSPHNSPFIQLKQRHMVDIETAWGLPL